MGALAGRRIGLLTAWASRAGGGVFEAVVAHAALLRALGAEPVVFALAEPHAAQDAARFDGAAVHTVRTSGPAQFGWAPGLVPALLAARLDLLHLHGIWMYPSHAGARWAARTRRAYVVSPHGMLDPWITARGRAKKALARIGYERAGWRRASFLHALTAREGADIARESGRTDAAVIPNAVPLAPAPDDTAPPGRVLLYIGRIHPKKNLLALVEAWGLLDPALRRDARLEIAGWGDAPDVTALEAAIAAAATAGATGIGFHGPVFGDAKAALLAQARFVVLPSLSEGLPMAMLEAWAAGTPTIMTPACNLPEGFAAGAAIECGETPTAIVPALAQALAMPAPAWRRHAAAARTLAAETFSPAAIARAWQAAYAHAIGAAG